MAGSGVRTGVAGGEVGTFAEAITSCNDRSRAFWDLLLATVLIREVAIAVKLYVLVRYSEDVLKKRKAISKAVKRVGVKVNCKE